MKNKETKLKDINNKNIKIGDVLVKTKKGYKKAVVQWT